jgi:hypothetical protein
MLSPRTPVATVRKSRSSTDTQDGKKTLPELFDGRSQLLAYNIMYGPDYTVGACPGCPIRCRRRTRSSQPYFDLLLDRTPKEQPAEPRNFRKDEYPD